MARPALFDRFPSLEAKIPWRALGEFPTAVEDVQLDNCPNVQLSIKRDDRAGVRYGGNKVRKLEFLLADAAARGKRRLVTVGAWGSHHVLATTLYGREAGFDVTAVVFPQPLGPHTALSLRIVAGLGAEIRPAASYATLPLVMLWQRLRRGAAWIAPGGSDAVGTLGWVSAGLELGRQLDGKWPDTIYVALGSCGTAAGLWLGLGIAGFAGTLVAVRVVDKAVSNAWKTKRLARAAWRRMHRADAAIAWPARMPALLVDDRFFGGGYAVATDAARAAVADAARAGMALETTYTGKAFAALLADARAGLLDGKRVLFVDTYSSTDLAPLVARAAPVEELPAKVRDQLPESSNGIDVGLPG